MYNGDDEYKTIKVYSDDSYLFEKKQPQSHFRYTLREVPLKGGFTKINIVTEEGKFSDVVFIPLGRNIVIEYMNKKNKESGLIITQYYGLPIFE
jgi:hypothetical protein